MVNPGQSLPNIEENGSDEQRDVEFTLQGDPVTCISIDRTSPEDFLLVINALNELAPVEIIEIDGEAISLF